VIISIERNVYQGRRIVFLSRPYNLIVDIKEELLKKYVEIIEIIENEELERSRFKYDSLQTLLEIRQIQLDSLMYAYKFDTIQEFKHLIPEIFDESLGGEE
jgi:hypothetical protein